MLCDECKKREAVFHSKIIHNGQVRERHLCAVCSKKYREEESLFKPFGDLFSSLPELMLGASTPKCTVCSKCGTTSDEFLRTGYVGCPECYKAFGPIMLDVVRRTQHDTQHIGKAPGVKIKSTVAAAQNKIDELRRRQRQAIDTDDFEEASRLRDEINELKRSIDKGGDKK